MRIATKFNLVLITIMSIALGSTGYFSHYLLQQNAQREVIDHAGMMMETALAIRGYTVSEVRPLLQDQMQHTFLPQSVPAYAATRSFNTLRKNPQHKEYSYKEATLNPTNPLNRATDWENDIIRAFRNGSSNGQVLTVRETPRGPLLHLARPIQIKKESCLTCHGRPDEAPETMLTLYNSRTNGFGWKLDEVVGAQIVTVPISVPREAANKAFINFMLALLGIFIFIFIALNILLRKIIIKPIIQMAKQANDVSMGNMASPEFNEAGKDELSTLGASFNRMRRSLHKAIKMIEDKNPRRH
jgi:protein-histidine pros-kinase